MLHAVILAGGAGTRLWPESRQSKAKQFLSFEAGRTLLQSTCRRLDGLVPTSGIHVLTAQAMVPQILDNVPELSPTQMIAEPCPRNTAPCIGLAALKLLKADPDATMIVLPADHLIQPENLFRDTLRCAAELVDEQPNRLITIGIKPNFPSSSYGYIQRNEAVDSEIARKWDQQIKAYRVDRFHEKPDPEKATRFLESGLYSWNAGIFIWKARTIYELLCQFEPEIGQQLERIAPSIGTDNEQQSIEQYFPLMKKISIDYAVMERAEPIVMLEAPFSWDDVGTWCALDRLYTTQKDQAGNIAVGTKLLAVESQNCVVRAEDPAHLFALLGLEDLIIVQTKDATLIAKKDKEESVREIIEELKRRDWNEYL